jgi:maleate cis-trans isomerase
MFGYRARIGYISPSVIELNAYDFYRIVPPGIGLVAVACMVGGWKEEAYREALGQVEACARELSRRNCDFVIHGGAPLVLSQGKGFETQLIAKLEKLTGAPSTTSIVAAMESFRDLGIVRLALVDPYPPELNEKVVAYLEAWDFKIASVVSLGTTFTESSVASIADIYRAAKEAVNRAGPVDGIFIPCANFPVVDVIEAIETDLGLPVVANITSQLYIAFKTIGMHEPINKFGRLLRMLQNSSTIPQAAIRSP